MFSLIRAFNMGLWPFLGNSEFIVEILAQVIMITFVILCSILPCKFGGIA